MITKINDLLVAMFKPGVILLGLLFFLINAHFEYILYHVNTYKMFMLGLTVVLLYVFNDLINNKNQHDIRMLSWQVVILLALPTIATLPGYLWHDGHNYNFRYELVTDIFLFLWAAYLFRNVIKPSQQFGFLAWLVLLIVFITIYSILEYFAINPLSNNFLPTRPKATFGNINYFSGFLATLTPMFLLLSLPRVITTDKNYSLSFDRVQGYFLVGFIGLIVCLLLAQSRAAIGATFIASLIGLTLWAFIFLRNKHRVYVIIAVASVVIISLLVVLIALFNPDLRDVLIPGRFSNLFQENAWQGRTSPLIAASRAFVESPWIGWGLGAAYNLNFIYMPQDTELYLGNRSYNHVHNEFLEMAEEGGILLFIVWGLLMLFIFYNLFKIIIDRNNQMQNRIIAIGCMTGIMAFYGHGVFSVAQRMVVANVPLYTLLGIALAQIYINRYKLINIRYFNSAMKKLPDLFWRFIPSTALIVLGWGLFIPIVISFYNMVKISPTTNKIEGVIAMEEHMKKWPNPYGLDDLMTRQIQFRRFPQLLEAAQETSKIIPKYRTLGFKESLAYFNINEYDKAKQRALEFQQRVGYHLESILLLGGLALREGDQQLFVEQLERLFQREIIPRSHLDSFSNKTKITLVISESGDSINLDRPQQDTLTLIISQTYLDRMITSLSGNEEQQKNILVDMASRLSQSKTLQLPTKPENYKRVTKLIVAISGHTQKTQQLKRRKRDAYLRSVRPKTVAEQLRAHKEIALIEQEVNHQQYVQLRENKKLLKQLLTEDTAENFLTLSNGINEFIRKIQLMSRYNQ